ncbi:MAG: retropepsin-like aspartic protease [Chthonomonadales bacterium]
MTKFSPYLLLIAGICSVAPVHAQVGGTPSAQGPGARVMPASANPDTIPFSLWNGLIVIQALFGDGVSEQAVLHTGLPICMVTPTLAAKKSMTSTGLIDVKLMDKSLRVAGIKPQMLRVDRFLLSNVAFGIMDVFDTLSNQTPLDAPTIWIGSSALDATSFMVDPRKMEVVFRPANAQPPPKCIRVPFTVREGRIYMEVTINGKQKFEAMLDTGAVATLIPTDTAKKLKLVPVTTALIEEKNGKKVSMCITRLEEVMLGKLHVKDIQAVYIAEPVKDGPDTDMAIIGNDLLLRYRFTIDYGRKEIDFEELPPIPVVKPVAPQPVKPEKKDDKQAAKKKDGKTNVPKGQEVIMPKLMYGPPEDKKSPPPLADTPPPPGP